MNIKKYLKQSLVNWLRLNGKFNFKATYNSDDDFLSIEVYLFGKIIGQTKYIFEVTNTKGDQQAFGIIENLPVPQGGKEEQLIHHK